MNAEIAYRYIGSANAQEPYLSNMIRALGLFSWNNTAEENARLEAAKWVKRNRKAYAAHCQAMRDARFSRSARP
jgi:hypothetical protein